MQSAESSGGAVAISHTTHCKCTHNRGSTRWRVCCPHSSLSGRRLSHRSRTFLRCCPSHLARVSDYGHIASERPTRPSEQALARLLVSELVALVKKGNTPSFAHLLIRRS